MSPRVFQLHNNHLGIEESVLYDISKVANQNSNGDELCPKTCMVLVVSGDVVLVGICRWMLPTLHACREMSGVALNYFEIRLASSDPPPARGRAFNR